MKTTTSPTAADRFTEEQLRERAYYIYLDRLNHRSEGDPESDWRQAELEMSGQVAVTV